MPGDDGGLQDCGARRGPGQAGDVYESEGNFGGRSDSRVRGGPGKGSARDLRRVGSGAGDVQDQGAWFASGAQRSPQRDFGPGDGRVVKVTDRSWTRSSPRSKRSRRQTAGQGLLAFAVAESGS